MSADAVIGRVPTTAAGPRLSRAKTPAALVEAATRVGRGTLSALGRCLRGTAAEHAIKRTWRFRANDRVHVSEVMPAVVRRLTRGRMRPPLVGLDWTDVRGFHTLMAAAVLSGRAVPRGRASHTTAHSPEARTASRRAGSGGWRPRSPVGGG